MQSYIPDDIHKKKTLQLSFLRGFFNNLPTFLFIEFQQELRHLNVLSGGN